MKLRIAKNSVRLRLSQAEASEWCEKDQLREHLELASGPDFIFELRRTVDVPQMTVKFLGGVFLINVPEVMARKWLVSGDEGLYGDKVSIERDLPCKHSR